MRLPLAALFLAATTAAAQEPAAPAAARPALSPPNERPAATASLPLVPRPREATARGAVPLRAGLSVSLPADSADRFAARDFAEAMRARRVPVTVGETRPAGAVRVSLLRAGTPAGQRALERGGVALDAAMRDEGYALVADAGQVDVVAASAAGTFYGLQTLKQLVVGDGPGARLLGARIRDWPAMRYRGFHDDLSRGPVPTLEFQKKQIRALAAYKVNVYSPYFEHTLAYRSHPLVAPPGGAMTREEVRELVDYARRYHVDVIPEQEAFGHLHHMLKYEKYADVAETPHGHVLAPGKPGSIPLIRQLFAEVDSLFPSRFVHLGADETFELGRGQTAERVKQDGLGAVYIDFLGDIVQALRPSGKQFLFWGDIAMNHPELVKALPNDMIAVAWWYDPSASFDKYIAPFRDAGMQTWAAPGVNNWNRVYPNNANALVNIRNFVRDAQRLGSTGVLTTSWDDDGEAIINQAWMGVLFGAAASWQPGESSIEEFERAYPRVFHGDTAGHVLTAERRLTAAHELLKTNGLVDATNYLFWLDPWSREGQFSAAKIRPIVRDLRLLAEDAIEHVARARAAGALREPDALDAIELGARRMDLIGMKFQFADEIANMYGTAYAKTRDSATARTVRWYELAEISGINGRLQDLRDAYTLTRELYERSWRAENRPYWLHNVLAHYDLATQLWISRADKMWQARQLWARTRTLPPPSEIGLPEAVPTPSPARSSSPR